MPTPSRWATRVAAGTVWPDKRLAARLAGVWETFAKRLSNALPHAADSWGQAQGLDRFLANPRGRPAALPQGRTRATARQCLAPRPVLGVQDPTARHRTGG